MFNEEVRFLASKLQPPPAVLDLELPVSLLDQSSDSQTIDISFEEEITDAGSKGNDSLDNVLEEVSHDLQGQNDSIDLNTDSTTKNALIEDAESVKSGEKDATAEVETAKADARNENTGE